MRISDWSSDVCSSDLKGLGASAGDDDAANRVAVVARRHRRDDRFRHFGGRGVELVGAVEGDRRDGTVDGEKNGVGHGLRRSEEHTSELQSLMRISYAVFCLKKKITQNEQETNNRNQQQY